MSPNCAAPNSVSLAVHACDGDALMLQCPNRTSVISDVLSAFYGRDNTRACPHPESAAMQNTRCRHKSPLFDTIVECVGRSSCTPHFTDPCPGVHKWASIVYTCHQGKGMV